MCIYIYIPMNKWLVTVTITIHYHVYIKMTSPK